MSIANDVHIDIEPTLNNDHHSCCEIITNDRMFRSSDADPEILPMVSMDGSHDEYLYYIDLDGSLIVARTGHGLLSPIGQELDEKENHAREISILEPYPKCGDDVRTICRICHLDLGENSDGNQLGGNGIQLGCHCRGDLGIAHKHCAETWFRIKGNSICEICSARALNVFSERENGVPVRGAAGTEPGTENLLENPNIRWGRIVMISTCLLIMSAFVISYVVG